MFWATYKASLKNIIRAKSFWLALAVLLVFVGYSVASVTHQSYSYEINDVVEQGHPLFVFSYRNYVQKCNGVVANMLSYSVPIFTVVVTVLLLTRDHGDRFFEIEKAGGMKAWKYLYARLFAAFTVCFSITAILCFVYLHGQMIPMLGCDEMTTAEYFTDSAFRLSAQIIASVPPCIIFYMCATYFTGTLLKSGIGAAAVNLAYVIFCYIYDMLNIENKGLFMEYLRPSNPIKLNHYMYYFDSEWFEWMKETFDTSLGKALLCWGILIGASAVFNALSHIMVRKRSV